MITFNHQCFGKGYTVGQLVEILQHLPGETQVYVLTGHEYKQCLPLIVKYDPAGGNVSIESDTSTS